MQVSWLLGISILVADLVLAGYHLGREPRPEDRLTRGHWLMIAAAIGFGAIMLLLLSALGLTRWSS